MIRSAYNKIAIGGEDFCLYCLTLTFAVIFIALLWNVDI